LRRKCKNNHTWNTSINRTANNHGCPSCKNKTETKLYESLKLKFPDFTIIHQKKFKWCFSEKTNRKYQFDIYIENLNMIIEIDGRQHFEQVSNWQDPKQTLKRDIFKMKKALNHNIQFIRITKILLNSKNCDYEKTLFKYITKKTNVLFICENDEYKSHTDLLKI
jgi:very-short-patch-repair endonuclease